MVASFLPMPTTIVQDGSRTRDHTRGQDITKQLINLTEGEHAFFTSETRLYVHFNCQLLSDMHDYGHVSKVATVITITIDETCI